MPRGIMDVGEPVPCEVAFSNAASPTSPQTVRQVRTDSGPTLGSDVTSRWGRRGKMGEMAKTSLRKTPKCHVILSACLLPRTVFYSIFPEEREQLPRE
jgi:hypothetical protein